MKGNAFDVASRVFFNDKGISFVIPLHRQVPHKFKHATKNITQLQS